MTGITEMTKMMGVTGINEMVTRMTGMIRMAIIVKTRI